MEDFVQIRKCLAGKKEAFESLVTKYKNLVFSIALNNLRNKEEAADVTQEVFLKVWANLSRFNPELSFKAWIAKITINHCINQNQKSKRLSSWNDDEMETLVSEGDNPEESTLESEKYRDVREAIDSLPEIYRTVIQLYHQHYMSYDEICKITGHSMSIVKNRIYRARKILAEKLSAYQKKSEEKGEAI